MPQIFELLPKVMADIGAIGKLQRNQGQHFNFRGIDDALNHCNPVLAKHGVSLCVGIEPNSYHSESWEQKGRDGQSQRVTRVTLLMRVAFFAPDGSSIENILAGEAIDYGGDKATNKSMAAAFKYGLFFGLCIPVERQAVDDSDRDETCPHAEPAIEESAAVDPMARRLAVIANTHTLEDLNGLEVKVDEKLASRELKAPEAKRLRAAIGTRRKQLVDLVAAPSP